MKQKRDLPTDNNVAENSISVPMKRKKLDQNHKINDSNKKIGIENNIPVPGNDDHKYSILIEVQKDMCYKAPEVENLFSEVKDAQNIILGRKVLVQYDDWEEAKKKVTQLNGMKFGKKPVRATFQSLPTHLKNQFNSEQPTYTSVLVLNAPPSTTINQIKDKFPTVDQIKKRKGPSGKFYILKYLSGAEAERVSTQPVVIDGTKPLLKLITPKDSIKGRKDGCIVPPSVSKKRKKRRKQKKKLGREWRLKTRQAKAEKEMKPNGI